ncbi:MAG: outer membrane protein OmpA/MotB family [Myxococcaceae bacterium]|nr:outer membrane protein OmpA/MotB family [Myxococcaceae bacterium]
MLLSRVWFLVLAAAAILGLSMALLARGVINREDLDHVDEQLRRDRFATEMLLKLDARARLDAIAPIAADSAVREAMRAKKVDGQDAGKVLKERLRTMNQRLEELRADLLIAVDGTGLILAQEGRKPARSGSGLGKVPLVERALSGFLGDDVWVYDGQVYRVAARPVIDRGVYNGAIIHAQKLDGVLAQRLSERLGGPSLGFFFRDKIIASYTPTDAPGAPTQPELTAQLASARADEKLKRGERTEPLDLEGRGRGIFSLVAGSASEAGVGYVVARGYSLLPTPFAIFEHAKKEDVDALPKGLLAGGFLALLLVAMGIMYLERDRPLKIFRAQVDKIAQGKADELDLPHLIRQHRMIGESMHKAIETMVEKGGGARQKPKANLDEILGPAPENLTSSAFSFGGDDNKEASSILQPAALPPPGAPRMPPPAPAPMPAPMKAPPVPGARPAPGPLAAPPKAPPPAPAASNDDKSVSVAFKLDAVAAGVRAEPASSEEDTHFRDVFDKFTALRRECGESTQDLTYERFLGTLHKHRDQIMRSRPDAKGVRFTVYAKEGKAALKAAPRKA